MNVDDVGTILYQDSIKSVELNVLKEAVKALIDLKKIDRVKLIVYSPKFRPAALTDQYSILKFISEQDSLHVDVRINASIACAHKALETLQRDLVDVALQSIEQNKSLLENIRFGQPYIRIDRLHITFSYFSVYIHLALFVKNYPLFAQVCEQAYLFYVNLPLEVEKLTLFQTCTNISRCFSFYMLALFIREKPVTIQQIDDVVYQIKKGDV